MGGGRGVVSGDQVVVFERWGVMGGGDAQGVVLNRGLGCSRRGAYSGARLLNGGRGARAGEIVAERC
jgi:hypothetical protein